jgi:DNA-binding IclR family transcriptional regulator
MPTNHYINVIERMMCVLEAFGPRTEVSLKNVTLRTGMVKSSVFRILYTLEKLGYVIKSTDGMYAIAPKFVALISPAHPNSDLIEASHACMRGLVDQFKETVNLGVLDGNEVLYIHVIESPHMLRLAAHAGIRSALHTSALGKCLTAYLQPKEAERLLKLSFRRMTARTIATKERFFDELEETRKRGFAIDNSEESDGICCVGVPIVDAHGRVTAALSISGPDSRLDEGRFTEVADALRSASKGISKILKTRSNQNAYRERST